MKLNVSRAAPIALMIAVAVALSAVVGASGQLKSAKDNQFKIMIISGFNTFSNANPEILAGAQAAAAAINKTGGIRGMTVVVDSCGHQNSVTGDADCARQAIAGGYADVIHRSSFAGGGSPLLKAAGIPEIGMIPTLTGDYIRNGNIFPVVTTSQALFVAAMIQAAKDKTLKKWAAVGVQNSGSDLTVKQTAIVARKFGRQYVGGFEGPITATPDMLPTAQKIASLQADTVICSCPVPTHVALDAAFNQIGYFPKVYVTNAPTATPAVIGQFVKPYGTIIGGSDVPVASDTSSPLVKAFLANMNAAGLAGDPTNLDAVSEDGWLDVWAVAKLAATMPKGTVPTPANLIKQALKTTAKNPINLFGVIKWAPGTRGPAAVPNNSNGAAFVNQYDPTTQTYKALSEAPIDVWKFLGIART
jgi:ABC-type branched-subunit amino acid transport system substrate-binding protein